MTINKKYVDNSMFVLTWKFDTKQKWAIRLGFRCFDDLALEFDKSLRGWKRCNPEPKFFNAFDDVKQLIHVLGFNDVAVAL